MNAAAREQQELRYDGGVWDEVILAWVEDPKQRYDAQVPIEPFNSTTDRITITDVLVHAVGKSLDHCTQADKSLVARCLIHAGWERKQEGKGADRGRWFYVREGQ